MEIPCMIGPTWPPFHSGQVRDLSLLVLGQKKYNSVFHIWSLLQTHILCRKQCRSWSAGSSLFLMVYVWFHTGFLRYCLSTVRASLRSLCKYLFCNMWQLKLSMDKCLIAIYLSLGRSLCKYLFYNMGQLPLSMDMCLIANYLSQVKY